MITAEYNAKCDKVRDDALAAILAAFELGMFSDVYMVGSDDYKRRIQYGEIVKIVHFAELRLGKLWEEVKNA